MISPLAAVVYADLFGYPLTVSEAKLWAIRKTQEKYSAQKEKLALEGVAFLQKIPTVEAVFLTGSTAVKNATKNADIDLMIITKPNTLWLTRLIVFKKLKSFACPNIFLDTNHLEIMEKNLYTAHEVLQAKCLYDRENINYLWLKNNSWTKEFLPNVYKLKIKNLKFIENFKFQISNYWLMPIELITFTMQWLYMKNKITNERMGWGYAFFHPRNLSEKIVADFEKKLKQVSFRRRPESLANARNYLHKENFFVN